jgi:DNA mismatch repair protein MutL
VFVNGRWVRNDEIIKAVYDAYHSLLFVNKHPICVLNVTTDPRSIDVNVHPNKLEIKFDQHEEVYRAVVAAVRETLEQNQLIPTVDIARESVGAFPRQTKKTARTYSFESSTQTVFQQSPVAEQHATVERQRNVPLPESEKVPAMNVLGQVHTTYFLAETADGVFFIDQHAVHERILYEQFMEQFMNKRVEVQRLLKGELLEFTPQETAIVHEHNELLESFGFTLEPFGANAFMITKVPAIFGRLQPKELIYEVISQLQEGKHKTEEVQEGIITRMACRAAVMAGDRLTIPEMEQYLKELSATTLPYSCPHGRPTMIKITINELEKKFRRT